MNNSLIYTILLGAALFFVPKRSFSQRTARPLLFHYSAYMDEAHGGEWIFMEPEKEQPLSITRFDFSHPGILTVIYGYGTSHSQSDTLKAVKVAGFAKEPRQMRGHALLGAYLDRANGLYELYYLSYDGRSLLKRLFWGPGRPMTSLHFSEKKGYNPFKDTLFPHMANDTVRMQR